MSSANVEPGAHPVAPLRRWSHRNGLRERHTGYMRKRIGHNLGFQRELSFVNDVGKRVSTTGGVHKWLSTIGVRVEDVHDGPVQHVARDAFNTSSNTFAGDRAAHQNHTALMPGEHTAPSNGFLRDENQLGTGSQHRY